MSNINNLILYESHKKDDDSDLPTRGDVGAGYGKTIGSMLASPLIGYPAGYYIGKHHIMSHPKKPMNPKSSAHRFGAMLNNSTKLKNLAIKVIGGGIGAALGGSAGKTPHSKVTGSAIGGAIGYSLAKHLLADGKENRHLAKKLGYGRFGRTAAGITPFAGLFKPKKQQDEEDKKNTYD